MIPTIDINDYYSTIVGGQYSSLEVRPGDNVLDAGAAVGDFSLLAAEAVGSSGQIVSLEPNPYYYSILTENIRVNELNNCIPLPLALSSKTGMNSVCVSLESGRRIEAHSITITDLLRLTALPHFDVVKLDIEGGEEPIFHDTSWLSTVRELVLETHGRTFETVVSSLEKSGFHVSEYTLRDMANRAIRFGFKHPKDLARAERFSKALGMRTIFKSIFYMNKRPKIVSRRDSLLRIVHGKKLPEKQNLEGEFR